VLGDVLTAVVGNASQDNGDAKGKGNHGNDHGQGQGGGHGRWPP